MKGPSVLTPGIVTVLDPEPAQGLADARERGAGRVPTAAGRWLQVERVATGLLIRDPAISGSAATLVQVNAIEAGRFVEALRRARG